MPATNSSSVRCFPGGKSRASTSTAHSSRPGHWSRSEADAVPAGGYGGGDPQGSPLGTGRQSRLHPLAGGPGPLRSSRLVTSRAFRTRGGGLTSRGGRGVPAWPEVTGEGGRQRPDGPIELGCCAVCRQAQDICPEVTFDWWEAGPSPACFVCHACSPLTEVTGMLPAGSQGGDKPAFGQTAQALGEVVKPVMGLPRGLWLRTMWGRRQGGVRPPPSRPSTVRC